MRLRVFHGSALILSLHVLLGSLGFAASGRMEGRVRDSQTGEPLPGANVQLVKTSLGASTDAEGRFTIRDIPPGSYTLRATYVGYRQKEVTVRVNEGETVKQDLKLLSVGVEGEEVVVTAQAQGQKEAINQQISALPIMNIVSRARIQELPDANAAESASRLPGVSLLRVGGEGSRVVIRGLSPQYNQITVEGVELPSNVTSQNLMAANGGIEATGNAIGDRGEDLSMISSSMLNGIEVIKAITPDMDAAVLGGVVNFGLRKAQKTVQMPGSSETSVAPMVELRMQGGYNQLKKNYDNYKWVASVEKRFFQDQSFGVFVQGSDEKRNLSSNNMSAGYALGAKLDPPYSDVPLPYITGMGLSDTFRKRQRMGGTAVLDYQHDRGEIALMNFFSDQTTQEITRGENYSPGNTGVNYYAGENNNEMKVMSNLLSVKHDFSLFRADLKISHSYTQSKNPEDLSFNFPQPGINTDLKGNLTWVDPKMVASEIVHDASDAWLAGIATSGSESRERTLQGSLDLSTDISLSTEFSTRIKIGGMFQHRTREFEYGAASGDQTYAGGGNVVTALQKAFPWLIMRGGGISMLNFINDSYQYGEFLNGEYHLGYPINVNLMWDMLPVAKRTTSLEGYQVNKTASVVNNYDGWENKSAVYAMMVLDFGPTISLIPGVRYQDLTTRYTGWRILETTNSYQGGPATVQHSHGYYLPMVHARYRPLEWLQLHFAYTQTLNYPDYSILTPRYIVSPGSADYNNHAINPARSENLDLVVSFVSNEIGLLSFNGFKKKIKDLIFFTHTYTADLSKWPELPQGGSQLYGLNTYINSPIPIDLYGLETEWQTHFWYLPKPFDGLVLNVNYTHIFSEASYPRTTINTTYDDEGNMQQTVTDTSYKARMLNQPNDIMNMAIGYDYGGLSLRISLLYTDNIFKQPDFWLQQRVISDKFSRWDLSVKQNLPWFGMQLFFDINNITGEDDIDINQKNRFPAGDQRYGMSMDLGVVVRL